jgi:hypothetical protein
MACVLQVVRLLEYVGKLIVVSAVHTGSVIRGC